MAGFPQLIELVDYTKAVGFDTESHRTVRVARTRKDRLERFYAVVRSVVLRGRHAGSTNCCSCITMRNGGRWTENENRAAICVLGRWRPECCFDSVDCPHGLSDNNVRSSTSVAIGVEGSQKREADMSEAVQEILQRIEQLPEDDRLILKERLAAIAEADWKHEAEAARRIARDRGIDQATIDKAVNDVRYPS